MEQISGMISTVKVELLPPVLSKGSPKEADFQALDNLASTIAQKHQGLPPPPHLQLSWGSGG